MKTKKKDIATMLATIKVAYPYVYKELKKEETALLVDTWHASLCDVAYELMQLALQQAIAVCKMPPTLADIMEQLWRITATTRKRPEQLWLEMEDSFSKLSSAAYLGFDDAITANKAVWDSLPEVIKAFCGDMRVYLQISEMSDTQLGYERNRFIKEHDTLLRDMRLKKTVAPKLQKIQQENDELSAQNTSKALPGGGDE